MTSSADAVVDRVLLQGSQGMKARPRTEVGFVAAITLGGVKDIAAAWRPLLKPLGYSLKIDGVFCHAAPVVDFKNSGGLKTGCELSDLLVVTDFKDKSGKATRKASLIQAKMASKAKRVSLTGPSSRKQLDLYQNWPRFKFREAAVYGTRDYSLTSVGNGDAGSFGVIDRHLSRRRKSDPKQPPSWTQHDAQPTPTSVLSEPTLGSFLVQMIGGHVGASGRVAVPGGSDDWSLVVDLLLDITYKRAFKHAETLGAAPAPRGTTAIAYLAGVHGPKGSRRHLAGHGWRPPFDGFEYVESDDPGGISMLRIEVSHDE